MKQRPCQNENRQSQIKDKIIIIHVHRLSSSSSSFLLVHHSSSSHRHHYIPPLLRLSCLQLLAQFSYFSSKKKKKSMRSLTLYPLLLLIATILLSSQHHHAFVSADDTPSTKTTKRRTGKTVEQVQETFDQEGFVVLRQFFDPETVMKEWVDFEEAFFKEIFQKLYDLGHTSIPQHNKVIRGQQQQRRKQPQQQQLQPTSQDQQQQPLKRQYALKLGRHNGFREIVMRANGRYDISLRNSTRDAITESTSSMMMVVNEANADTTATATTTTSSTYQRESLFDTVQPSVEPILEKLSSIIPALLHKESEHTMSELTINQGLIVSTAGATEQQWHSDGEHLTYDEHLPCHILNIFIPLINVTEELGPTELFPTSHYATRKPPPMQYTKEELKDPVAPTLALGDVLIFDYRTLHRGKANVSRNNRRPFLIFTVSLPDFADTYNFPENSMFPITTTTA